MKRSPRHLRCRGLFIWEKGKLTAEDFSVSVQDRKSKAINRRDSSSPRRGPQRKTFSLNKPKTREQPSPQSSDVGKAKVKTLKTFLTTEVNLRNTEGTFLNV